MTITNITIDLSREQHLQSIQCLPDLTVRTPANKAKTRIIAHVSVLLSGVIHLNTEAVD